jgi:site-specific DNA-methyltransferase (adenine-specific)
LWQIFDEIKRVLKKTGTCWVNLGDSYGGSGGSTGHTSETKNLGRKTFDYGAYPTIEHTKQYQAKSLLNIPSRFAIGMTDRGWILRNEIIWYKRSCMPSSAKDRFTVDFEKIFFFTKNKKYYFEQQFDTAAYDGRKDTMFKGSAKYNDEEINPGGGVHTFAKQGHQRWSKRKLDEQSGLRKHSGYDVLDNPYVRNKRCVWDVVPEPEKEAHFACFPQKLIEPMIKAGCPEKGIVLDPFFGSGTTGVVAKKLNRNFIGVELQEKYVEIAHKKFNRELGMFNTL